MKTPELLIVGFAFFVLTIAILIFRNKLKRKVDLVISTPIVPIGNLLKSGAKNKAVAIKGKLIAENDPLYAPFSDRTCVYYESIRKDAYEKRETGMKHAAKYAFKVMENLRSNDLLTVEDPTGKAKIDPKNFIIYGRKIMGPPFEEILDRGNSFFSGDPAAKPNMVIKQEQILTAGTAVFLVGKLLIKENRPLIGAPDGEKQLSFITIQSVSDLVESSKKRLLVYNLSILISIIATVTFIALSFTNLI